MDTTPEYIKMCEKAEEIQNDWILHKGDYYYHKLNNKISFVSGWFEARTAENAVLMTHYHGRLIWLPRQDQLQAMIKGHWTETLGKFTYWLDGPNPLVSIPTKKLLKERVDFVKRLERCDSMEQLWLAFVMKELYGKVWNGDDWA